MLWTRVVSGVVLLAAAVLALGLGGALLAAVLFLISLIAYRELARVFRTVCGKVPEAGKRGSGLEIIGMVGIALYYAVLFFSRTFMSGISASGTSAPGASASNASAAAAQVQLLCPMCVICVFMAMLFAYVITFPRYRAQQIACAFFSFVYAPVMLSFVYLTRALPEGLSIVWLIIISSWGCDTCAYLTGILIGRKKIFPKLSPKKSLEGCIGGLLGAALLGGLYGYFVMEAVFPGRNLMWITAFICGAGSVMGQLGDLAASAIKRNFDVKDYGKLIPGHGGIMDRFDSMIVTAPMIYFLAVLMI